MRKRRCALKRNHSTSTRHILSGESLETRRLLSVNPTPFEQALLEDINRFRSDPGAELAVLFSSLDPLQARDASVRRALDHFGVNAEVLLNQWSQLQSAPPLAFNESLMVTASAHTELMIQTDTQAHDLPDQPPLLQRVANAGYDARTVSQNVFAYAESHIHTHAGFIVDWGDTTTGIQQPPGHRNNILDPDVVDIGISVVADRSSSTEVGPFVVTQDFAEPLRFQNPFALGVIWADNNTNGIYDPGEGMGGVDLTITGGGRTYQTTSMDAGGYQIRVAPGTYSLTASGGQLGELSTQSNIVVSNRNVKVDVLGQLAVPPVADPDTATVTSGDSVVIDLLNNDVAAQGTLDPTSVAIIGGPANGQTSVTATTGQVTYTPNTGFVGVDSFRYTVRDSLGRISNEARVSVTVENSEPISVADQAAGFADSSIEIQPLANDSGFTAASTLVIDTAPNSGAVTIQNQTFTYTGDQGFTGQDSFSYHFVTEAGDSNTSEVTVTIANRTQGWQNPFWQFDVDNDGNITPVDAILVINDLGRELAIPTGDAAPPPWIDIDGDSVVTPVDALFVINNIGARRPNGMQAPLFARDTLVDRSFDERKSEAEHHQDFWAFW